MNVRIITLVCLSAVLVSCASTTVRIHPHQPEAKIRDTILQHTPIASSRDSVLSFIDTQLHHNGPPTTNSTSITDLEVGWYWTEFPLVPMITYVYVSWNFDSQNHLVEVTVTKEIDAP
jgi:hypothetical protein